MKKEIIVARQQNGISLILYQKFICFYYKLLPDYFFPSSYRLCWTLCDPGQFPLQAFSAAGVLTADSRSWAPPPSCSHHSGGLPLPRSCPITPPRGRLHPLRGHWQVMRLWFGTVMQDHPSPRAPHRICWANCGAVVKHSPTSVPRSPASFPLPQCWSWERVPCASYHLRPSLVLFPGQPGL